MASMLPSPGRENESDRFGSNKKTDKGKTNKTVNFVNASNSENAMMDSSIQNGEADHDDTKTE